MSKEASGVSFDTAMFRFMSDVAVAGWLSEANKEVGLEYRTQVLAGGSTKARYDILTRQ
jgi:hypothetical protein